jgi:pimeloyl-ACP methyl ester carboxylesterase
VARPTDSAAAVELPGPWTHRYVAANGSRFHVAELAPEAGSTRVGAPLVVLLHGFPEFWWTWRSQLPALAAAGFLAVAMDLRGYGGSDKPPRGYDPFTLAADVSGVVKALGAEQAIVVGHGWGGYVGWAAAALHAREVAGLCAVAAPHPLTMLRSLGGGRSVAMRHVLSVQLPLLPERRLSDPLGAAVARHLRGWSGTASFPDAETAATYQRAIGIWPAAHCALEYHRWLFRSRLRADGRAFSRAMRSAVPQPVLAVAGGADPALPAALAGRSAAYVTGRFDVEVLDGLGHFPHEEDHDRFTGVLLGWLDALFPATRN